MQKARLGLTNLRHLCCLSNISLLIRDRVSISGLTVMRPKNVAVEGRWPKTQCLNSVAFVLMLEQDGAILWLTQRLGIRQNAS